MNRRLLVVLGTTLASAVLLGVSGPAASANPVPTQSAPMVAGQASGPQADVTATGFRVIDRPTDSYTADACLADLSTVPQGTSVTLLVTLCGFQIEVTPATIKESVPRSWPRWGKRPYVEDRRPDVLWTDGSGTVTLSWAYNENHIGGVEVQPRISGTDVFTARYYSGPNGTGTLIGTVTQRASSPGGARLLAAQSTQSWQSIVISSRSGNDFAIAEIRSS